MNNTERNDAFMTQINWKVRFRSKTFLVSLFMLVLLLAQHIVGVFGADITIYNEQITDIFNTVISILVLIGIVHDPTTPGVNDSQRAMSYHKPGERK